MSTKPINFRGIAHPKPAKTRSNGADMSAAEIASVNLGRRGGTALHMEHDMGDRVGTVTSSWEGRDGSLRVSGVVTEPSAVASVRSGATRGLSLGTSVITNEAGKRLCAFTDELSLCEEPRRAGCYVTDIDGAPVRQLVTASAKSGARLLDKVVCSGRG